MRIMSFLFRKRLVVTGCHWLFDDLGDSDKRDQGVVVCIVAVALGGRSTVAGKKIHVQ